MTPVPPVAENSVHMTQGTKLQMRNVYLVGFGFYANSILAAIAIEKLVVGILSRADLQRAELIGELMILPVAFQLVSVVLFCLLIPFLYQHKNSGSQFRRWKLTFVFASPYALGWIVFSPPRFTIGEMIWINLPSTIATGVSLFVFLTLLNWTLEARISAPASDINLNS